MMNNEMAFPKKVFTYWAQGFSDAPLVVRTCIRRLDNLNPGWEINLLDSESVWSRLSGIDVAPEKWARLCIAHQSDLIRTKLLIEYGGVWMDPTVYCATALDDWLPRAARNGLFFFRNPGADRMLSNWLVAGQPGHVALQILYRRLCGYWNEKRLDRIKTRPGKLEYAIGRLINRNTRLTRLWMSWPLRRLLQTTPHMIYHYMVNDLFVREPDFGEALKAMPEMSAWEAHALQRVGLLAEVSSEILDMLECARSPVFKLNWRLPERPDENSLIAYLSRCTEADTA